MAERSGGFWLVAALAAGAAFAGNLLTFLVFYEFLTLSTYPLVIHRQTDEVRRAGRVYLAYTIAGGAVATFGTIWLYTVTGTLEFATGGSVDDFAGGTMKTTWNASWTEIPISLGMKVPVKPHWFVYGNAGVSIFKGGFDITVDIDVQLRVTRKREQQLAHRHVVHHHGITLALRHRLRRRYIRHLVNNFRDLGRCGFFGRVQVSGGFRRRRRRPHLSTTGNRHKHDR